MARFRTGAFPVLVLAGRGPSGGPGGHGPLGGPGHMMGGHGGMLSTGMMAVMAVVVFIMLAFMVLMAIRMLRR